MKYLIWGLLIYLYCCVPVAVAQNNRVVVVPFDGGIAPPSSIIVTVGNEPGEGDFQSVAQALASITDASAAKRYAIFLTPGDHSTAGLLQMKEHVDLIGSRGPFVGSSLTGTVSSGDSFTNSAVVRAADNMTISDLLIRNQGDNAANLFIALEVDGTSPSLANLILRGSGGRANYGLLIENDAAPSITQVTANGSGGIFARGVLIRDTPPLTFDRFNADASGASSSNRAVFCTNSAFPNDNQSHRFLSSTISAQNGGAQSVYLRDCQAVMENSTVTSDDTAFFYESNESSSGNVTIADSTVQSPTIINSGIGGFVGFNSTAIGDLSQTLNIKFCQSIDDGTEELDATCQPPSR